jgi:hypothetical protein
VRLEIGDVLFADQPEPDLPNADTIIGAKHPIVGGRG